jgi:hypothetical protein
MSAHAFDAHAFEPVQMQPLNLLPLFQALGIQPPPPLVIPPMPEEHPALVHEGEAIGEEPGLEGEEGLFEDWTTVYQEGPDHPDYTDADIPGILVNTVQEGFTFLEIARGVDGVHNDVKNDLYFTMKAMMFSLMNGLIGNLQDIETCWHADFAQLIIIVDSSFDEEEREVLDVHLGSFRDAFGNFVQWISDTMTPHGLGDHAILPEIYQHYVRHMLRPQVAPPLEEMPLLDEQPEGGPQGQEQMLG